MGPTRGGVANAGYSPPLLVLWGDTPRTPRHGGLRPLVPPFTHPRWLWVRQRFGPHSWAGLLMQATRPLFWFYGGTPPTTPRHGGLRPLDPRFAHPRWLRVRQCFGPHSWAGCRGWQLAPSFGFWGHIPQTPWEGLRPLHPPSPPPLAEDSPEFWAPLVGGLQGLVTRPFLSFRGGTPPTPPPWGHSPPGPPICPPPWA